MQNKQILKIYHSVVSPIIEELERYYESIERRREGKERGKGHELVGLSTEI